MRCFLLVLISAIVLAALLLPAGCNGSPPVDTNAFKAAIIDQLYLRQPNPTLINGVKSTLQSYGFQVDIWQGNDVTVDFYGRLPSMGYRVIILRAHSGLLVDENGTPINNNTYLFTAENYSTTKYVGDQLSDKVSYAIMEDNSPYVFAVSSDFIKSADGNLNRTIVIALGCESFRFTDMAGAFADKGASAYIGWSDVVTLDYVDGLTLDLVNDLFSTNMTLDASLSSIIHNYGRDPYFNSTFRYYPISAGNSTAAQLIGK